MATIPQTARDDRVLLYNRVLSGVIVPFLVVAFVILYGFPDDTDRLFAWSITPSMTPMTLAAAYAGGAYFFTRMLWIRSWNSASDGFLAVALFAGLLGVATVMHWEKFHHSHLAFWLWAGLYFTTPVLVIGGWVANQRGEGPAEENEPRIPSGARWAVGVLGLLALMTGVLLFAAPGTMIPLWPWRLTPLTSRVMGAIFCLGAAGIGVLRDPNWARFRLMIQVEALMVTLILIGAVRDAGDLFTDRPLTWLLLGGLAAALIGSGWLWLRMERSSAAVLGRPIRHRVPGDQRSRRRQDQHVRGDQRRQRG